VVLAVSLNAIIEVGEAGDDSHEVILYTDMANYPKFSVWLEANKLTIVKATIIPDAREPLFDNGDGMALRGKTDEGQAIETSAIAKFVNMKHNNIWTMTTMSGSTYHVIMDDTLAKKIVGAFYQSKNPVSGPTATPQNRYKPPSDEEIGGAYGRSMERGGQEARRRLGRG